MIGVTGRGAGSAAYYSAETGACSRVPEDARSRSVAEYHMRAVEHGEPEGRWYGPGVAAFGLAPGDTVDHTTFAKLVDDLVHPDTDEPLGKRPYQYANAQERADRIAAANPDATPEELATLRLNAQRQSRQAQHAWDITPSVPKSVSVLHAALEREGRQDEADAVMRAVETGIAKTLDIAMRDLAYTRDQSGSPNVAGRATSRYVHNPNWTVAVFMHTTSRDQDPQLHGHAVVLNRVQDPATGRWKTLYSPALTKNKHMLDSVFSGVVQGEVTRQTGHTFATRPDGMAREVRGVEPDVRDFFSTRSRAVAAGAEKLIQAYRDAHEGREPGPWLRYQINQYVTLDTRRDKAADPPTRAEELARWDTELGGRVRGAFASVLAQADAHRADRADETGGRADGAGWTALGFDPGRVIEQAVADLDEKSTWTRGELYHAIWKRMPDDTSHLDPDELVEVLDDLTDAASRGRVVVSLVPPAMVAPPDELLDERGRFVFDAPGADRFTTRANLAREDSLLARLDQVGGRRADEADARAALAGRGLGDDQHGIALDILTSDKRVHVVVGPAGVGKSRLMGALDGAGRDLHGHGLVGLTTAENAAQVLRGEGVTQAYNIRSFLNYHERAAEGRVSDRERERFAIPAGATVVFDEAGTVSTRDYYEAMAVADRIGIGKIVMIGDEQQTDAVDNAGAFNLLAEHADTHRMETVRRFRNDWEAAASTRVREGDATVVHDYDTRGRVHGGSAVEMRHAAVDNFVADYLNGEETLIVTSSSEEAAHIGSMVRERLIQQGVVGMEGVELRGGTLSAGAGDRVQTRQNDTELGVVNREMWTVRDLHDDGGLTLSGPEGAERRLPGWYVREHIDLGYAGTIEAAQGRTVDAGHLLVDPTMGRSHLYPGLTRGRERNTAYVETREGETAQGRLADVIEHDDHKQAARTVLAEEMDRAENLGHIGSAWQLLVTEDRQAAHREVIRDVLGNQADRVLEDRASAGLYRLLRHAEAQGRDPRADLTAAMAGGGLDTAQSPARALHGRLDKLGVGDTPGGRGRATSYAERTPGGDDPKRAYARELAEQMDGRVTALGMKAADERPAWAERLGEVPDDPAERQGWIERAGQVAAFREQYGHDDDANPIGSQPSKVEPERRWVWNRAADALGVDEAQRDIEAQTEGALHNRVDDWKREQEWLPPNVDDRLKTAHLAAAEARRQAAERADEAAQERMSRAQERTERLEAVAAARAQAMEATREKREAAALAEKELARRKPEPEREDDPEPEPEPERVPDTPEREPAPQETEDERDARDLSRAQAAMAELARRREEARERKPEPVEQEQPAERAEPVEVGE